MRVIFVTHNYPRTEGDPAGGFLRPLAIAIRERGHDVRVVAPSDQGKGGTDRLDGIEVTRVRYGSPTRERYAYTGRMQDALRSPGGWVALLRMIRGLKAGARAAADGASEAVVHAHWWFPAGVAAPSELPTVITLHGTDAALLERPLAPFVARAAFRRGRVVTAVSHHVAGAVFRASGITIDRGHTLPMPVVMSRSASTGGGGLVFVGRLTAQKRVDLALEAHALLARRRPGLAFTIVGDGPERPALERRAAELGTGLVRFVGQVAPEQVPEALGSADLFVFPARREGLGLATIEALAAGIPVVVCRDGGGVLDVMEEPGAGVVVEPNAGALESGIERLLGDPYARDTAAAAGRAWLERLSPATVAARCEEWYREAARG